MPLLPPGHKWGGQVMDTPGAAHGWRTPVLALCGGLMASSCCLVQLALNVLSVGCAGFAALDPYRPIFLALTAALLIHMVARNGLTRRTLVVCCLSIALASSRDLLALSNKGQLLPSFLAAFQQQQQPAAPPGVAVLPEQAGLSQVESVPVQAVLLVAGMKCEGCAAGVRRRLSALPGVTECNVDFAQKQVSVQLDLQHQSVEGVMSALRDMGYEPELMKTEASPPHADDTGMTSGT